MARLLGHPIHWDTETVGCDPSLSSIPVADQRTFADALSEIRAWLDLPQNAHEFVVLYLDDQIDLSLWVRPLFWAACHSVARSIHAWNLGACPTCLL